jgi:hypothetical protein
MTSAPGVLSFSGPVQYTPGIVGAVEFSLRALFSGHLPSESGADGNQVSFSPLPVPDPDQRHEPKNQREISAKNRPGKFNYKLYQWDIMNENNYGENFVSIAALPRT